MGPGSSAVSTATVRYAVTASEPFKGSTMVRIRPILSTAFLPNFCRSPPYSEEKKTARNIEGINVTSTIILSVFH